MKSPEDTFVASKSTLVLTPTMKTAVALLLQARETAVSLGHETWDFALEIQALKEAGVNHNDLRYLICQGIAEHRVERTRPGSKHRAFRLPRGLRLARQSCFTLPLEALPVARQFVAHDGRGQLNGVHLSKVACDVGLLPFWDKERRELRLGDVVVKRFRQPARNQETILTAFQEDGWPVHLDNPLSGNSGADARARLHETVKKLNHQINRLLHFSSDGIGQGVVWTYVILSTPCTT